MTHHSNLHELRRRTKLWTSHRNEMALPLCNNLKTFSMLWYLVSFVLCSPDNYIFIRWGWEALLYLFVTCGPLSQDTPYVNAYKGLVRKHLNGEDLTDMSQFPWPNISFIDRVAMTVHFNNYNYFVFLCTISVKTWLVIWCLLKVLMLKCL